MTEDFITELIDAITNAVDDAVNTSGINTTDDLRDVIEPIVRRELAAEQARLDACTAQVETQARETSALVTEIADALTLKKELPERKPDFKR